MKQKIFKIIILATVTVCITVATGCTKVNTDASILKQLDSISGATRHH